ncbi:MAG: hypothetical protein COC09_08450 [Gammaproteobacteria bacterium]|nr:type III pantothenate kinase [Gammaproteobacteria bacterium]PCH62483.1 MAG: hypothetical protein COC09_08450 [Gammaproteobacteria bacterium]
MILLVDIGNTRIKWTIAEGGILSEQDAVSHELRPGLNTNLDQLAMLDQHWAEFETPERVVIANGLTAVPVRHIESWVKQHWLCPPTYLTTSKAELGVVNAYDRHQDLGIDRWMNLLASHHLVGGAACIIDCGTAVTVDAIKANGTHLGGCILPGVTTMRNALNQMGAITIEHPGQNALSSVNRSTKSGVYCGTLYAVTKAIDAIIVDMKKELGGDARCIITGGDAELIRPLLQIHAHHEKDWVFQGMLISVNQ